ncbi:MAG: 50S ribosomal protein L6 [Kiritimatiellae bacterium]|nr:50S ribosomal protein L6 [Kiritimatiellia bacterium]
MSRLAKKPIALPSGVTAAVDGPRISVRGPKGELSWTLPAGVVAEVGAQGIVVRRLGESADHRRLQGTSWSIIAGMVTGVHQGYVRELEVQGVGYRAQRQGSTLSLTLGFSHPIEFPIPPGVDIQTPDATTIRVSGCSKALVGDVAARIRSFYRAEPYKGKGIRYKGEQVRRKAGKTVA